MKIFFPTYAHSHLPKKTNFYSNLFIKYIYSILNILNIYLEYYILNILNT